jgi:hypothetical protein
MISNSRFNSFPCALAFSKNLASCETRLLVSVSGGQDSMLLAWVILQFQIESKLSPIWLYHNHIWHAEGFFHGVHCWRLSIVFDWPFLYTLPFQGIFDEDKGWAFRYHLRRRLSSFYKTREVLLGHTRTDRSESILFNFLRGSLFQPQHSLDVKKHFLPDQRTYSLNTPPLPKIEMSPSIIFSLSQSSLTFISPTFSTSASSSIKLATF